MPLEEIDDLDERMREIFNKDPAAWKGVMQDTREHDTIVVYTMAVAAILVLSERTGIAPFRIATWFAVILPRQTINEIRAEDAWLN